MEYRTIGRTDLQVSALCLGTMTFVWRADKETSFAIMDRAVEEGINFFDTADIYSKWIEGNPGGVAEAWIGDWLADRKPDGIISRLYARLVAECEAVQAEIAELTHAVLANQQPQGSA